MKKLSSILYAVTAAAMLFAQETAGAERAKELTQAALRDAETNAADVSPAPADSVVPEDAGDVFSIPVTDTAETVYTQDTAAGDPVLLEDTGDGYADQPSSAEPVPSAALNKERYDAHEEAEKQLERIHTEDTSAEEKNVSTAVKRKRRAFSMHSGLMIDAAVANNLVSAMDFLQPNAVIDLTALAKNMIPTGAHIGAYVNLGLYSQFTVLETHTVRFFTTVDGDVWGNIPKNIFEVLGQGNVGKNDISGGVWGKARVFAATGLQYTLKKPIYSVSAKAAYFVPVAYIDSQAAKYKFVKTADGGYKAVADVDAVVYTPFSMFLGDNRQPFSVAELFQKGGIDLTLSGSYTPVSWVDVLFHVQNLPILPASMDKGIRKKMHFGVETKNLLKNLGTDAKLFEPHPTQDETSFDVPQKKVMRQCKIGVGADFRPFSNNYLIINPRLAFPITEAQPFYADAGLKLQTKFARDVLSIYYDLDYTDRMWRHEVCFAIDSRWFSFNLAAAVASHSFARTFHTLSGAGIKLGIGLGF